MKTLMLTTAIMLTTSGIVAAQTTAPANPVAVEESATATAPAADHVPAFRVSDFIGKNLHVLDPEVVTDLRGTTAYDESTARWTSGDTFIAGRDQWDDIGQIDDLVLTQDGQLRGVLLDIGGFLGIGARTVMVDISDLYFVADTATPEDLDDFFVVASMSRDQLEALPEWQDDVLSRGYPAAGGMAAAPVDDGAGAMAATEAPIGDGAPTTEELTGADVQDSTGNSIGTVGDLVLDGSTLTGARIDVGGFLGMGTHDVIVPIEALMVTRNADGTVEHVRTTLTREQLEALPAQN